MPEFFEGSSWGRRFLSRMVPLGAAGLVVLAGSNFLGAQSPSAHAGRPVKESMFVQIGGIPQWITIKGEDRNNPVVLFLHGGPGDALSPFADAMYAEWEKEFTLVQWDQRGAGRTYGKSGPSIEPTMTVDRMAQDGIEVAEFLIHRLHKRKIILVGDSWGTILGVHMALARPELFYAYLGVAQIVNWHANLSASYARVLEMARAGNDREAVAALMAMGPPPWHAVSIWPKFRKWQKAYQARLVTAPPAPSAISPAYASPQEQAQYEAADDFSFLHFWGMTLSGPFTQVDLAKLGTSFSIPIFMIQGQQDLSAIPDLARAYFDSIHAPGKEFYLVPGTGHGETATELELMRKVLLERVRPLAVRQ